MRNRSTNNNTMTSTVTDNCEQENMEFCNNIFEKHIFHKKKNI